MNSIQSIGRGNKPPFMNTAINIIDYVELRGVIYEAGKDDLPIDRIDELLQHPYWFVRNTVLMHQPLDFMQVTKLLFDENQKVRMNAANHPLMQEGIDNFQ